MRCPPGEARITAGYNLQADYVVHAVAPLYDATRTAECERLLALAYRNALELALSVQSESCAFPALGCGVNMFDHRVAARIALEECSVHQDAGGVPIIEFVMRELTILAAWRDAAEQIGTPLG